MPAHGLISKITVTTRSSRLFDIIGSAFGAALELVLPEPLPVVPLVILVELGAEMNGLVAFESSRGP